MIIEVADIWAIFAWKSWQNALDFGSGCRLYLALMKETKKCMGTLTQNSLRFMEWSRLMTLSTSGQLTVDNWRQVTSDWWLMEWLRLDIRRYWGRLTMNILVELWYRFLFCHFTVLIVSLSIVINQESQTVKYE